MGHERDGSRGDVGSVEPGAGAAVEACLARAGDGRVDQSGSQLEDVGRGAVLVHEIRDQHGVVGPGKADSEVDLDGSGVVPFERRSFSLCLNR